MAYLPPLVFPSVSLSFQTVSQTFLAVMTLDEGNIGEKEQGFPC